HQPSEFAARMVKARPDRAHRNAQGTSDFLAALPLYLGEEEHDALALTHALERGGERAQFIARAELPRGIPRFAGLGRAKAVERAPEAQEPAAVPVREARSDPDQPRQARLAAVERVGGARRGDERRVQEVFRVVTAARGAHEKGENAHVVAIVEDTE